MTTATVNGTVIDTQAIAAEVQFHPADNIDEAASLATRALVVRELLLQQARRDGIRPAVQCDARGRLERDEEALIRQLLEERITVPEADREACRRYFDDNRGRFRSPALYEPAHILLAASPKDEAGYEKAVEEAQRLIAEIESAPDRFETLARIRSDCTSKENGGCLGQVMLRDVVPEFATFLCNLDEGQLCPVPVRTRYGAHVLRLDRKVEGRALPFDSVADRIADFLQEREWRSAVAAFVQLLAGNTSIEGISLDCQQHH